MGVREEWIQLISDNVSEVQQLGRVPEPCSVTDSFESVSEYDRVCESNMMPNYCTSLDLVYRARGGSSLNSAIDVCCGPGHQTGFLSSHLGYSTIDAIDLSAPMVDRANSNFASRGMDKSVVAYKADATNIKSFPKSEYDLSFFSNSAHHFPTLDHVAKVVSCMEEVTADKGLVVVADLGRLKTKEVTERFVSLAGQDFLDLGMPHMYEDFKNSMYAAWLPEEMATIVPKNSKRLWFHIVPDDFPSYQAIIGLPVGRDELFVRDSNNWVKSGILRSDVAKTDWFAMKSLIENASKNQINDFSQDKLFEKQAA